MAIVERAKVIECLVEELAGKVRLQRQVLSEGVTGADGARNEEGLWRRLWSCQEEVEETLGRLMQGLGWQDGGSAAEEGEMEGVVTAAVLGPVGGARRSLQPATDVYGSYGRVLSVGRRRTDLRVYVNRVGKVVEETALTVTLEMVDGVVLCRRKESVEAVTNMEGAQAMEQEALEGDW